MTDYRLKSFSPNFSNTLLETFKTAPFWNQLSATQSEQVYPFDYYGLVNPGSIDKILQTCRQLEQALRQVKG